MPFKGCRRQTVWHQARVGAKTRRYPMIKRIVCGVFPGRRRLASDSVRMRKRPRPHERDDADEGVHGARDVGQVQVAEGNKCDANAVREDGERTTARMEVRGADRC